jgi:hypothetical protein
MLMRCMPTLDKNGEPHNVSSHSTLVVLDFSALFLCCSVPSHCFRLRSCRIQRLSSTLPINKSTAVILAPPAPEKRRFGQPTVQCFQFLSGKFTGKFPTTPPCGCSTFLALSRAGQMSESEHAATRMMPARRLKILTTHRLGVRRSRRWLQPGPGRNRRPGPGVDQA